MHPLLRAGIVDLSSAGWTGGGVYSQVMAASLHDAAVPGVKVHWVSSNPKVPALVRERGIPLVQVPATTAGALLPGEFQVNQLLGRDSTARAAGTAEKALRRLIHQMRGAPHAAQVTAAHAGLDVVYPFTAAPSRSVSRPVVVGWVPDLQHVRLPEFFNGGAGAAEAATVALCRGVDTVVLSSQDSARDLAGVPAAAGPHVEVLPFPSAFAFQPPDSSVATVRQRYQLPEMFVLVANQFWSHKNHGTVVAAVAHLAGQGCRVPVVMTGLPLEHRDGQNSPTSQLLQAVAASGARDLLWVLGLVPLPELHALLRSAAAVLQPSRFEGWSTSVQDALALGRPVICSDIPVHREQAPDAVGFFKPDDHVALAGLLRRAMELPPGPDPVAEAAGLARERAAARTHGLALARILQDAVERSSARR